MLAQIEQDFGRELKALKLLIEKTEGGLLTFGLYSDIDTRDDIADWLKLQCGVPLKVVRLSKSLIDLAEIIEAFPPKPRRCFLFLDVPTEFSKFLGYVNFHREVLMQYGHALVFCIREEGLRRIAEDAPDFWAWRSNVFDFRTAQAISIGATGSHDGPTAPFGSGQLAQQVTSLEQSGRSDLGTQIALGRRQLALGRFEGASSALEQALAQAQRQNDKGGVVESLYLLGNSKLEQGLLDEAERLYARSLEIADQIGSKEFSLPVLRQLSIVAQRSGSPDSAYNYAMSMIHIANTANPTNMAMLASAHDQLGNVYFGTKNLRSAEQEYRIAAKYEEQLEHNTDLAFTLANLGRVYVEMGAATEAESFLLKAAQLFKQAGLDSAEQETTALLEKTKRDHS